MGEGRESRAGQECVVPRFQHLELARRILNMPILTDEQREVVVGQRGIAEDIGMRTVLYTGALRSHVLERRDRISEAAEHARRASRTLALLANFERAVAEHRQTEGPALWDHQNDIRLAALRFMQSHPHYGRHPQAAPDALHGLAIVAPTAAGKGAVLGRTVAELGIGKPPHQHDPEPLTAVIVVPTQHLVDEYAATGGIGDQTFIRFCGMVPTRYFANERNTRGPVIVATEVSFARGFKNGRLSGKWVDIVMLDEVHHLTGPNLQQTIRLQWRGPLIGATATPAYNTNKDVRRILSHSFEHGNLLTYTENGLTNGARLYSIPIEPKQFADQLPAGVDLDDPLIRRLYGREYVTQAAVDFAYNRILQGRRGLIVCEPGGGSEHAKQIAELLSAKTIPAPEGSTAGEDASALEPEPVIAHAIGTRVNSRTKDSQIRAQYKAGKIHALTTTEMGKEGLNLGDVDFVILAIPRGSRSMVKIVQFMGRGARHSETFPFTDYAEIFIVPSEDDDDLASIWAAYNQDTVEQGKIIMRRDLQPKKRGPGDSNEREGHFSQQDARIASPWPDANADADLSDLPEYLRTIITAADTKPVGEFTVARADIVVDIPPEYSATLASMVEGTATPERLARHRLEKAGFDYKARREVILEGEHEGERTTVYYFTEAARDWLAANPVPPRAAEGFTALRTLCERTKAPSWLIERIATAAGLSTIPLLNIQNREFDYYDPDGTTLIRRTIEALPTATATSLTPPELIAELNSVAFVARMRLEHPVPLVLMRNRNGRGFDYYLPASEVHRIRTAWEGFPLAEPDERTLYHMAKEAGISRRAFMRTLTPADWKLGPVKRGPSGALPYFKPMVARWLVERARPAALPHHLIPIRAIADDKKTSYLDVTRVGVMAHLDKYYPNAAVTLRLPGSKGLACIDWGVLRALEDYYGRGGDFSIHYDSLPKSEHHYRRAQRLYAREVQQRLVRPVYLSNIPDDPAAPVPAAPDIRAAELALAAAVALLDKVQSAQTTPPRTLSAFGPPYGRLGPVRPQAQAPASPAHPGPPGLTAAVLQPPTQIPAGENAATSRPLTSDHPLSAQALQSLRRLVIADTRQNHPGAVHKRTRNTQVAMPRPIPASTMIPKPPTVTQPALSTAEIAARTGVSITSVQTAIERLGRSEFKMPAAVTTKDQRSIVQFSGPFLDAILTEVAGLTPEGIARRIGFRGPMTALASYLEAHYPHIPERPGRYNRAAVRGAAAALVPQAGLISATAAAVNLNISPELLIERVRRTGYVPRKFYTGKATEEDYFIPVTTLLDLS